MKNPFFISVLLSALAVLNVDEAARLPRQIDWTDLRGNVNYFMDTFLENAQALMVKSGMQRIPLPDQRSSFKQELFGIPLYGSATAFNGSVMGMESIHRSGDAHINFTGSIFYLTADVGLKNVSVNYNVTAQFMGYGPEAEVTGGFDKIQCYMELLVPLANVKNVTLNEFKFHNLGRLKLDIQGLGSILDTVLGTVLEEIGNSAKDYIASQGEDAIKERLNETLTNMHASPFGTLLDML